MDKYLALIQVQVMTQVTFKIWVKTGGRWEDRKTDSHQLPSTDQTFPKTTTKTKSMPAYVTAQSINIRLMAQPQLEW